ncbi:hypothetical protein M3589_07005 [Heyndrickxia oleronia]|uniref:hypothetical protein n=1 Tax=Heyndrickxia oleronia TaxID=38875 RepID=UPI00203CD04D|nr:hypothetical protein [Heyndrickxia oleronia]MCM3237471.1 hypothetical protein [Heyndrickxia oleronia]
MRNKNLFVILMLVLPWLTIPFIEKKTIKRFLPGTIMTSIYLVIEGIHAEKKKWWRFNYKVKPNVIGELPLILGPFFVGSIWILKYTFGKFKLYFILNIIIDSFFTYLFIPWMEKTHYVTLVKLSKFKLSILFLIKSLYMYVVQYIYEKAFNMLRSPSKYIDEEEKVKS